MIATFRGLLRRPARTSLTVLGVAVGFSAYVGIRSAASGLVSRFNAMFAATGAEVTVQQAGVGYPIMSRIAVSDLPRIADAARAASVSGVVTQMTRLPNNNQLPVFGIGPKDAVAELFTPVDGAPLSSAPGTVVVGTGASASAGVRPGGSLEVLPGRRFPVAGVFRSPYGFLDAGCVLALPDAQRLFTMDGFVSLALVKLRDPSRTKEAIETVNRTLPHLHAAVSELFFAGFRELELVDRFARFLGLAALAVSALGVANTLAMNAAERRPELAILRAVGWGRWRVAGVIALEGAALSAAGIVAGLLPAFAFVRSTGSAGLSHYASSTPSAGILLGGAGIVLLAGALGSLPAVLSLFRTKPASALRSV